jgi:rod shape-determining protein MreD
MKWLPFFIFAYVMIGLQVGVGAYLHLHGAAPNLVLIAAVYIALNAPRQPALLGCFVLGLIQDLLTLQPLGVYALGYSLLALFVLGIKDVVSRDHPASHFLVTFIGGLLSGLVLLVSGWIRGNAPGIGQVLLVSLYSAIVAPVVLWALGRVRGVFSFTAPRRRL